MIKHRSCPQVVSISSLNTWLESWQHFMTVTCHTMSQWSEIISPFSPLHVLFSVHSFTGGSLWWVSLSESVTSTSSENKLFNLLNKTSSWSKVRYHMSQLWNWPEGGEWDIAIFTDHCLYSSLCQLQIVQFLTSDISHLYLHILPPTYLIKFLLLVLNTLFIPQTSSQRINVIFRIYILSASSSRLPH